MKVFLISTPRGSGEVRKNYKKIYDEISRLGYEHVSDFIASESIDVYYERMHEGRNEHVKFFNDMVKSIQTADICVFETSTPSFGVGFLIQRSIDYSKPTVVLYYGKDTPYFLSGIEDEKLIIKSYDEKNYEQVLRKALEAAREKRDKRFNFFLSPKLLQYIDDASKERGITKSKLLRDMIVKHMRDDNGTQV